MSGQIQLFDPPGEGESDPSMVEQLIARTGRAQEIDQIANDVMSWADAVFPDRTDHSMFLKLYKEIGELVDAEGEDVSGELADVLIMLLDFGKRKKIDIAKVVRVKLEINKARVWKRNALGVYQHVKGIRSEFPDDHEV